jgi:hypothetical protein
MQPHPNKKLAPPPPRWRIFRLAQDFQHAIAADGKLYPAGDVVYTGRRLYLAPLFRQLLLRDVQPDEAQLIG